MKQIKNDISVYIQNVAAHKFMKDKLLGLVDDCKSNPLDNVSNTDWHESNTERKYWDCFYSMIEPYLENLCLRLNKEKFTIVNYWFQQYETNSKHDWHIHFDNLTKIFSGRAQEEHNQWVEKADGFGGIYYLELPEDVGTEFLNYPKLDYQEGDLVTFPAFLPHRSPINLTNKRKTSIVFNYTYE